MISKILRTIIALPFLPLCWIYASILIIVLTVNLIGSWVLGIQEDDAEDIAGYYLYCLECAYWPLTKIWSKP